MVASRRPAKTESHPFHMFSAPTDAATVSPKKMRENISGGPNAWIAQRATVGAAIIITIAEKIPPIEEDMMAAPIAFPD